jgi:lipoprotein-anchoring transpeptidase ErfK/SrfK
VRITVRRAPAIALGVALIAAATIGSVVDRANAAPLFDPRSAPTFAFASTATARARAPHASVAAPTRPGRSVLVHVERSIPITARPGGGAVVGTMPADSRFYGVPLVPWVQDVSRDGRFGLVTIPYHAGDRTGWIALRGLRVSHTTLSVDADLSEHEIVVRRGDDVLLRARAATGAPASPTPTGHYFVTDRVPFAGGGPLGTFAFGLSGIQPDLPAGWSGGDQLAIHGTDDPSSIGTSASAGCLRVSERTLARLEPLLRLGTPVVIHG